MQDRKRVVRVTLLEKCPYSELFWSVFLPIRTEYAEISPSSVRMRENTDQNDCEYGLFLRSVSNWFFGNYFVKIERANLMSFK